MATSAILRLAAGGVSRQLLRKSIPLSAIAVTQKQKLHLTPISQTREFGPKDAEESAFTSHWSRERYLTIGLIPLVPLAIATPHPALDMALCTAMVLHSYWGFESIITDYVHGHAMHTAAHGLLLALSILAFSGLTYMNYNDIGFARMVRRIYSEL